MQTTELPLEAPRALVDWWPHPATIGLNNFVYKSLSSWAYNVAVGCEHACRFCYVPSASTIKLGPKLKELGTDDPDEQWGQYLYVRRWNAEAFAKSMRVAEDTPVNKLNKDGNRAVMLCSTTDPYQVVHHPDAEARKALQGGLSNLVRGALSLINSSSTLNVRILTRSPLAKRDLDLMKRLGNRCLFGMSIPTLNNALAKVYEPKAPAPTQRLEMLKLAKNAGIPIYVAMAPTYPECDEEDLERTLTALGELEPLTIFHEPINIRAENVARIAKHAASLGVEFKGGVFANRQRWEDYAKRQLFTVETLAVHHKLKQLHLWPDKSFGTHADPEFRDWLLKWWNRVSEWPK